MRRLLMVAALAGFVGAGLTGCDSSTKSASKQVNTVTKPDGSKTTETKEESKKETPPK